MALPLSNIWGSSKSIETAQGCLTMGKSKTNFTPTQNVESCFFFPVLPYIPNCLTHECVHEHRAWPVCRAPPGLAGLMVVWGLGQLRAPLSPGRLPSGLTLCWCVRRQPSALPKIEKSLKELSDFCHHWRIWQVYPKGFYHLLGHWAESGHPAARSHLKTVSYQHTGVRHCLAP